MYVHYKIILEILFEKNFEKSVNKTLLYFWFLQGFRKDTLGSNSKNIEDENKFQL